VDGWLSDALDGLDTAHAVAVADSAIHTGVLDPFDWEEFLATSGQRHGSALDIVDGIPDSGTESILRFELWKRGVHARSRAVVDDGKEVDLLVGDRLIIEVDSSAHHGSGQQRIRDLHRDAELTARNYLVLRFDYMQVMFELELVLRAVFAVVESGQHRWPTWV
jgi:very-short-patch-repair endonuclease